MNNLATDVFSPNHDNRQTSTDVRAVTVSNLQIHGDAANDSINSVNLLAQAKPKILHKFILNQDQWLALIAIILISPILIVRAVLAFAATGRVFERKSVNLPNHSFVLLRFSGFKTGRNLARIFNVLFADISLIGEDLDLTATNDDRLLDTNSSNDIIYGYFSHAALRRFTGTNYNDDEINPDTSGFKSKIVFLFRYGVARMLATEESAYRTDKIDLLGVDIDNFTVESALDCIMEAARHGKKSRFSFVNPDCLNTANTHPEYQKALRGMSAVFADGIGLQIAARMLRYKFKANVNGTDLFPLICEACEQEGLSIYLLGGRAGIADATTQWCKKRYPNLKIAGYEHGYFDVSSTNHVIDRINKSQADILLVAFGAPKQELWIDKHSEQLAPSVQMGVGGLFDFYSGRISRSPRWMQEVGLEWVWRLIQEPRRMWHRYIVGNPLFIYRIFRQRTGTLKSKASPRFDRSNAISFFGNKQHLMHKLSWRLFVKSTYFLKRTIDIFASLSALIVLSPLFLIVSLLIRIESPGPVFFVQRRVGQWGSYFNMYKFRSMRADAESLKEKLIDSNEMHGGVTFKMKSDPRITRVGQFIRKYSIDELPQLLNVLKGDMALVGPRPPVPSEVDGYALSDRRRLEIKPGITCSWQVSGRSEIPFKQQVKLDVEYIESQSFKQDIAIMLKTIPAVLLGKGAY